LVGARDRSGCLSISLDMLSLDMLYPVSTDSID